ncbi:prolyl oligopeptidase family serine peptidase [Streptosporangium subroseum]|uniref:prolyl oligopeptidase family serine peptidase n=1 Tax=Streptosporangium subroseum TaxID=106412 RepID=UPI0034249032
MTSARMHRCWSVAATLTVGASMLVALPASAAADGRRTYTGQIDGATYRVEMPREWNGTLLLYSHGYHPKGFPVDKVGLTNHPQSEKWLLDHGYALAASQFKDGGYGYQTHNALQDQIALLDWFTEKIEKPRRTVATGQSMGAVTATLLAERHPRRFAGAMNVCGNFDAQGTVNAELDVVYTVKTLLAPGQDIDLVRPKDPEASTTALVQAAERGMQTPQGRARLALAGAFSNVADWYSTHEPRPTALTERLRQQASWITGAHIQGFGGPIGHADLEPKAGGNPAWNTGVDYDRQLRNSAQKDLVKAAYKAAGLDLRDDLKRLAAAPRIAPDPQAVRFMHRYGVPRATAPVPMITAHNTGDGGAGNDQARWYADQVRRTGASDKLRQVFLERGSHCALSAAEEIVTLQTLLTRLDTGQWPTTSPDRMNTAARGFSEEYQTPVDFLTGTDKAAPPAFVGYTPPIFLRPSR